MFEGLLSFATSHLSEILQSAILAALVFIAAIARRALLALPKMLHDFGTSMAKDAAKTPGGVDDAVAKLVVVISEAAMVASKNFLGGKTK